jgi:hypothetical protein
METDNRQVEATPRAIKYQLLKLQVVNKGATVNINTNSDKLYKRITGIMITAPFIQPSLNWSTLSLQINDKEIFPDDFEARLIAFEQMVPANERFFLLDEPADGSTIKGRYTDIGEFAVDYPHVVRVYLRLEEKQV